MGKLAEQPNKFEGGTNDAVGRSNAAITKPMDYSTNALRILRWLEFDVAVDT